ncbi:MAG TPA: hypothetical protein VHI13_21430 [Candidatus Kapabacteria bacterium]|nr:hypothetical protein [Candidatus Kapabacteria bacterium]
MQRLIIFGILSLAVQLLAGCHDMLPPPAPEPGAPLQGRVIWIDGGELPGLFTPGAYQYDQDGTFARFSSAGRIRYFDSRYSTSPRLAIDRNVYDNAIGSHYLARVYYLETGPAGSSVHYILAAPDRYVTTFDTTAMMFDDSGHVASIAIRSGGEVFTQSNTWSGGNLVRAERRRSDGSLLFAITHTYDMTLANPLPVLPAQFLLADAPQVPGIYGVQSRNLPVHSSYRDDAGTIERSYRWGADPGSGLPDLVSVTEESMSADSLKVGGFSVVVQIAWERSN